MPLIKEEVEKGKSVAIVGVDGGPDLSPRNSPNIMKYGRMWMEGKLGALGIFDRGAKLSAYNEIERAWCPATRALSGVLFKDHVEGDDKPSASQVGLSDTELEEKEKIVFDTAGSECATLLQNAKYADDNMKAEYIPCFTEAEKIVTEKNMSAYMHSVMLLSRVSTHILN